MSIITCAINIFDYDQTIYLINSKDNTNTIIGKSSYENLEHLLVTLCDKYNVSKIKLGGLKEYTSPLKNRIEKEAIARYNKKVEVEI